jgi:hypothetical protein
MSRRGVKIIGGVVFVLVGGYFVLAFLSKAFLHHLPPENYTSTSMYPLKTRILRFANINDRLPHNLEELPPLEGFTNRTVDVWGNEIIMKSEGTKVVLLSYGKDQAEGGKDDNLDVVGVIETKDINGGWVNEDTDWLSRPLANEGKY